MVYYRRQQKNRIENAMSNLDREETRHGIKLSNDAFSQVEIYVQTFLSTFNLFLLLSKMTKIVNVLQSCKNETFRVDFQTECIKWVQKSSRILHNSFFCEIEPGMARLSN